MKDICHIALCLAISTIPLASPTLATSNQVQEEPEFGDVAGGFHIGLRVREKIAHAAEPVRITIVVKNASDHVRTFGDVRAEYDFNFSVRGEEEEEMPLTLWGKYAKRPPKGLLQHHRYVIVKLGPGETKEFDVVLNWVHDMTMPGTYKITASRTMPRPDDEGGATVTSNTVFVEVRQPHMHKRPVGVPAEP